MVAWAYWRETTEPGLQYCSVHGQFVSANGTLLGQNFSIVSDCSIWEFAIAFDTTNRQFLLVGRHSYPGGSGQFLNEDGTPVGERFDIPGLHWGPTVAYDSERHRFLIAWRSSWPGPNDRIYGQLVNAGIQQQIRKGSAMNKVIAQTGNLPKPEIAMDLRSAQVTVHNQDMAVDILSNGDGQIGRHKRLALTRHRAGHQNRPRCLTG